MDYAVVARGDGESCKGEPPGDVLVGPRAPGDRQPEEPDIAEGADEFLEEKFGRPLRSDSNSDPASLPIEKPDPAGKHDPNRPDHEHHRSGFEKTPGLHPAHLPPQGEKVVRGEDLHPDQPLPTTPPRPPQASSQTYVF